MKISRGYKNTAITLRKQGFSYSEIMKSLPIPKATLSYWFKKVKLSPEQVKRLEQKRAEAARTGTEKRKLQVAEAIEKIKKDSAEDIKKLSAKELWLMGIVLYWRERLAGDNDADLRKGVRFTSSDPYLVKLFLKWLKEVGGLANHEIDFDIFLGNDKKNLAGQAASYWSQITDFPQTQFCHIYFQKTKLKKKKLVRSRTQFGLLRTRVKASSMLARQIAGWVQGLQTILKD